MRIAYLTRRVRFSAAHRYHRSDWSDEQNRLVFGACNNPVGHGHNYVLEVTVRGAIAEDTGFCVDLGRLDGVLQQEVVGPLDHQHLNHAIAAFADGGSVPTCENVVTWIWPRIQQGLPPGAELHQLRLYEDPDLFVDYYGGGVAPDAH
jgi:6-pyruvoyltetrahydropterin/6-carboxytetrahydropterin synthase